MRVPVRIFIHGLESSSKGTKGVFFRQRYPEMMVPDFSGDLQTRMKKLREMLSHRTDIILVGSSFGGLMAALFALENESRVSKLILLAPAIHLMETRAEKSKTISVPTWIYHGKEDQFISLTRVETVAREIFTNLSFYAVNDDHYLHGTFKTIDWDAFLG